MTLIQCIDYYKGSDQYHRGRDNINSFFRPNHGYDTEQDKHYSDYYQNGRGYIEHVPAPFPAIGNIVPVYYNSFLFF